jgi:hypothetical protein
MFVSVILIQVKQNMSVRNTQLNFPLFLVFYLDRQFELKLTNAQLSDVNSPSSSW